MLLDVVSACTQFDGFTPHGPAEGKKIKRLLSMGLLEHAGIGECQTCRDPHDAQLYILTELGRQQLTPTIKVA